jgi:hypothetical protein
VGERRCSVDEMGAEVYTGRREKEDGPDRDARSGLMEAGSAFLKATDMLAGSDQYRGTKARPHSEYEHASRCDNTQSHYMTTGALQG